MLAHLDFVHFQTRCPTEPANLIHRHFFEKPKLERELSPLFSCHAKKSVYESAANTGFGEVNRPVVFLNMWSKARHSKIQLLMSKYLAY